MAWRSRLRLVTGLPLRLKLGASAAILFFAAALVVVSLIVWRQEVLAKNVAGDAAWAAYKLDRETIQMRNAVLQAEDTPQALHDVRMRFELLYSRINLLRQGEIAELFRSLPDARALVPEILSRSDALDAALRRMSPDTPRLSALDERLQALSGLSERLVVAVNAYLAQAKTREREVQLTLYATLLALILLMCGATVLVIRFLFQEAGDNIAARQALEHLSQELKDTAREAESANQAKSDFLATVSHEVRTPLNGVIGLLSVLSGDAGLNAQQTKYVQTAHQSAQHLLGLLNEILDISKMEAGKLELEPTNVRLDETIDAVLRLIEMTVTAAHAQGKWVGVCGELASDRLAVPLLIGLGVDELSVTPRSIALVKARVREVDSRQARTLVDRALALDSASAVRALVAEMH